MPSDAFNAQLRRIWEDPEQRKDFEEALNKIRTIDDAVQAVDRIEAYQEP